MSENKEYLTIEQECGSVHISEDVLASIAALAIREVDGVAGAYGVVPMELTDRLNKKSLSKGIRITVSEHDITVDCSIAIYYGTSIAEIGAAVQEKITATIQAMTSLTVRAVNVHIGAITMAQKA